MDRAIAVFALVFLAGCYADPVSTAGTNNPQVPVSLLFEHDGCRVYRFTDYGRERYFANCPNHTSMDAGYRANCGKGCSRYVPHDTTTSYGGPTDGR